MNLQVCCFSKEKEKGNGNLHLGPWNNLGAHRHALGRSQEQGRRRRLFPGEEEARRRRGSGGTARGRRDLLGGRLVEVGGGRWRGRRRSSGSPAASSCGGAAPAWEGGRRPAGKLHWTTRERVWGSICVEVGRGVGLHGGLRRSGGHGADGGVSGRRQELGWSSGAREGRVGR